LKNLLKITFTLIFTTILLLGFAVPLNPAGNWYQQFMPNIGGRQITDITFTDSLNGYAITNRLSLADTSIILRTTNRGDNWFYTHSDSGVIYNNIQFVNQNTGFVSGYIYIGGSFKMKKTTDMGLSWFNINAPFDVSAYDMFTLNQDTIWLVDKESLSGGVYFTSNGGTNWTRQFNVGTNNPDHIYMYNRDIGFVSQAGVGGRLYKTTNSGVNWTLLAGDYFTDMYFADSLTGWKCSGLMKKTTDGGLSWLIQELPSGGILINPGVTKLSGINRDTIWAVGATAFFGAGQFRGLLYRTTNGGNNWLFQIPDTTIHIVLYNHIQFLNNNIGWAYANNSGVHTTTGGDPVWIIGIEQISTEVPQEFNLYQNYPNPFNPTTTIKFSIPASSSVAQTFLSVYNTLGEEISTLVNQQLSPGTYSVDWNASNYPSGIYFCKLTSGDFSAVKKMILVK